MRVSTLICIVLVILAIGSVTAKKDLRSRIKRSRKLHQKNSPVELDGPASILLEPGENQISAINVKPQAPVLVEESARVTAGCEPETPPTPTPDEQKDPNAPEDCKPAPTPAESTGDCAAENSTPDERPANCPPCGGCTHEIPHAVSEVRVFQYPLQPMNLPEGSPPLGVPKLVGKKILSDHVALQIRKVLSGLMDKEESEYKSEEDKFAKIEAQDKAKEEAMKQDIATEEGQAANMSPDELAVTQLDKAMQSLNVESSLPEAPPAPESLKMPTSATGALVEKKSHVHKKTN